MNNLSYEDFLIKFGLSVKPLSAIEELKEYNIINEYNAMKSMNFQASDLYKTARLKILQYIINCVNADSLNGDYYNENNRKLMIEAGNELNKEGGMKSMHDDLVWSFIPKRYHREIDYLWNGIGEWKC